VQTWFPSELTRQGDRPAILTDGGPITYAQLGARVDAIRGRLGTERRLVLLGAANHPDAIVVYLAALAGGHPVIIVGAENDEALRIAGEIYDPDVVALPTGRGGRWVLDERRAGSRHVLHPELALLLSTSGSTGSPKLVRLSRENLQANAESIATFLAIGEADRAMTSLPLAYCYGLSVLNSHLLRGASVVVTDRSVVDPAFWDLARRTRATSFAGVPYTFDLLDRIGFAGMELPHLRYVTQAGGRLDPATVRRYAELGRAQGWDLYVMYGQTEATARMTFLPPALAATRPESVGRPVAGGSIRLDPIPGSPDGAGELVYRGANVMLGYAESSADLALGPAGDELRTGDLARRGADGMYEIVGRLGAFLKIAGLRIDASDVERLVERTAGAIACAVGTDDELVVFVEGIAPPDLHARIRDAVGLPGHALRVVATPELTRRPNGKPDRVAMRALAASSASPASSTSPADAGRGHDTRAALAGLYASALGVDAVRHGDSFTSLGGDSLSYVEITLGLEEILGRLPDGWAAMPIAELAALAPARTEARSWWSTLVHPRAIEMSVALRAIAIVLIVATHIGMLFGAGGAHVLMAVAGFNFGRFRLTSAPRARRARSQLRAVARIAIPAMLWVGFAMLLLDQYELRHLLLVNALVRDELWGNLWFIELLVYIGLAMAALLAVPAFDRAERHRPFAVAMAVVAVALLFRFEILDFGLPHTKPVLWLFALGWAASRAERSWQRWLVAAVAVMAVPGYFDAWERNAIILVGLLLLIGIPHVRVPGGIARAAVILAAASLYIYLVHWEVWPIFSGWYGIPSLVASLAAGVGLWLVANRASRLVPDAWRSLRGWSSGAGTALGRQATGRPR
jgi:acyl-CoA synthetase (AMP-forming)/AMP-acid ligase II